MELREKVAEIYWMKYRLTCSVRYFEMTWEELKSWYDKVSEVHLSACYDFADKILAVPEIKALLDLLERTRDDCLKCDGYGFEEEDFTDFRIPCTSCNGTGKSEPDLSRLVILSKDQTAPCNLISENTFPNKGIITQDYLNGREELLREGFRKVEP